MKSDTSHQPASAKAEGNSVSAAIQTLCQQYQEGKARWKAMKSIRWVLQSSSGQYAALEGIRAVLTSDSNKAQVFDGRDNETAKAQFYSATLKTEVTPVIISCAF